MKILIALAITLSASLAIADNAPPPAPPETAVGHMRKLCETGVVPEGKTAEEWAKTCASLQPPSKKGW